MPSSLVFHIGYSLSFYGFCYNHTWFSLSIFCIFEDAKNTKGKPSVIIAKTIKGKGISYMENQAGWHGKAPTYEEACLALEELGGRSND